MALWLHLLLLAPISVNLNAREGFLVCSVAWAIGLSFVYELLTGSVFKASIACAVELAMLSLKMLPRPVILPRDATSIVQSGRLLALKDVGAMAIRGQCHLSSEHSASPSVLSFVEQRISLQHSLS